MCFAFFIISPFTPHEKVLTLLLPFYVGVWASGAGLHTLHRPTRSTSGTTESTIAPLALPQGVLTSHYWDTSCASTPAPSETRSRHEHTGLYYQHRACFSKPVLYYHSICPSISVKSPPDYQSGIPRSSHLDQALQPTIQSLTQYHITALTRAKHR